jgi:S-layer protein (TIGR01567 family)
MQHNIKKLACLLAILLLGSCCPADAKSIEIRGTPGSVEAGSTMLLDGFNFPELIYRISDDRSYECLNISFAKNGTINEGDASYTTKLYKNSPKREIMFMGSKYHSLDPDNADTLTKILKCFRSDDEKIMSIGDVWELDQNYTLTISGIDQNGDKATLELAKNSDVVEFTVIGEGDTFEYKTDVESTDDIILFTCKVDTVLRGTNSTIVVLKVVRHYSDTPLILETGDKFGDFKVTSITNDTIEMKNSKTISCSLDETIDLLDDWIKLEVSDKGYWGYVYSEEILECPEILEVSSVTESTDTGTTAQNTTASNTSDDTGTNSTVAAVLPATSAATPIATSAVTTETEQPLMLAASGGAGIAPHALPAPGVALLVGLFAILALMMNIRRNEK